MISNYFIIIKKFSRQRYNVLKSKIILWRFNSFVKILISACLTVFVRLPSLSDHTEGAWTEFNLVTHTAAVKPLCLPKWRQAEALCIASKQCADSMPKIHAFKSYLNKQVSVLLLCGSFTSRIPECLNVSMTSLDNGRPECQNVLLSPDNLRPECQNVLTCTDNKRPECQNVLISPDK